MPCTTLLVGKKASYDGSTLMARNEDSSSGFFNSKKFVAVNPKDQPKHYKSVLTKFELDLPDNPLRYSAAPNADLYKGIWGEAGINEKNVAMTATETITSNPRVVGADPIYPDGLGEEDLITIVLPYISTAKEGVLRLGSLIEQYGTCEMNGIGFQDINDIWWFESIGGHHWIAKRVPDDCYVVMPNQQGIDYFDFTDAFGEQKNNMCSSDMIEFITINHLDREITSIALKDRTNFNVRCALGGSTDEDHVYNTCRAWDMARHLNPNTYKWDGEFSDYNPYSDNIPWNFVPEAKLSIEDVKETLSRYYQGTEYNPYNQSDNSKSQGKLRPIGINRNNILVITQIRPYMPDEIKGIEWISEGSNAFNTAVPFYSNVSKTPNYFSNTTLKVTTDNFYWANRIIGVISDAHYNDCIPHIERYQLSTMSKGHNMIKKFDKEFIENRPLDTNEYLEQCNQKISDMVEKETYDVLDKVMYSASLKMHNAFFRSDN